VLREERDLLLVMKRKERELEKPDNQSYHKKSSRKGAF
jgi:hypothetical protein